MIRLRQVALVAAELDPIVDELCATLELKVVFRDPGVSEFGLHNALMMIGDQFLEVVAPTTANTTAGRLLEKRGGDGGYMAIYEVDDLDRRMAHLGAHDVRTVWAVDFPDIRSRHLHPRDVGGTLVSIDQPKPAGSWLWGGPDWEPQHGGLVASIAGVTISATDSDGVHARWRELELDQTIEFTKASERGDGLDAVDLVTNDRARVGESHVIGGVSFRFI